MSMFSLLLKQTYTIALRKSGGMAGALAFYVIAALLLYMLMGLNVVQLHAPAVLCITLLLGVLIALPQFYECDHEDGSLEEYLLQPMRLEVLTLAKAMGVWLAGLAPLLIMTPLLLMIDGFSAPHILHIMWRVILASPFFAAAGSFASALSLGKRGVPQHVVVMVLSAPALMLAGTEGVGEALLSVALSVAAMQFSAYASAALIRRAQG